MPVVFLKGRKVKYEITETGCWIVTSHKPTIYGYIQLTFWDKNLKKTKHYFVHRLMYCKVHNGKFILIKLGYIFENTYLENNFRSPWGCHNGSSECIPKQTGSGTETKNRI